MAFFVLLGMVAFLFLSPSCHAELSKQQEETLKKDYGLTDSEITNLGKTPGASFEGFYNVYKGQISKGQSGEDAAAFAYKDLTNPSASLSGEAAMVNQNSTIGNWIADKASSWIGAVIFAPIIAVLYIIGLFCMLFVNIAAYFLDSMVNPALYHFTSETIITTGWTAVRDVCNLFFLLILLFIAFCTILQIEKYHAKKTLLIFILMALLVNFSKPIAIFIFDGSQLLMNFFLNKLSSGGSSLSVTLTNTSEVAKVIWNDSSLDYWKNDSSAALAAKYIMTIIFLFMLGVAYIVMAIFLLIRIVALWILIILSPLAFLFNAVPDFKKISSQWWDALFKYSYVGPAIAFFLWLSTLLMDTSFYKSLNSMQPSGPSDPLFTWVVQRIIPFFVILVFLYASIIVSQKFGIAFASAITSRANKALSFFPRQGWAATKYGAKAGLKMFDRDVLMKQRKFKWGDKEYKFNLSPRAWKQGWKERAEEMDKRALSQAAGSSRDNLNSFFKGTRGTKPEGFHGDLAFSRLEEEMKKEISSISTESGYLCKIIEDAEKKETKTDEDRARVAAALKMLFESNDQDDFMLDFRDYADFDPFQLRDEIRKTLEGMGMSTQEAARQAYQLGSIALSKGNLGHYGMGKFNSDTGQYEFNDDDGQIAKIVGKYGTMETQQKAKILHRNALITEGKVRAGEVDPLTGKTATKYTRTYGKMHRVGQELARETAAAELGQMNRARGDTLNAVSKAYSIIQNQAVNIMETDAELATKMAELAKTLHEFKTSKPK
ncbi:MAG: hypothetical protein PHP25_00035 [Candidatus Moranbacteria bacterium]|nr:hypothetical protein [Candidatus Moranbacteria bacterium]